MIKLAALILNYNDYETTISCVNKIKNYTGFDVILIVDNKSSDDSFNQLKSITSSKVKLIKTDKNGGYGYGNNFGINYLIDNYDPTHIMIMNPDVFIEERVVEKIKQLFFLHPEISIIAPSMLNIDGRREWGCAWKIPSAFSYIMSADLILNRLLAFNEYSKDYLSCDEELIKVDCVAGSLLVINAQHMKKYGMYDENMFLYGEETLLGIKMKNAGCVTALLPNEFFLHLHGVSIKKSITSDIIRRKLMLNSRSYILNNYYHISLFMRLFRKMVFCNSMIQYRLLLLFKKFRMLAGVNNE